MHVFLKIPRTISPFCLDYDGADSWTQELTHMYFENATYNHRNHTSWLSCACIASSAFTYPLYPEMNSGMAWPSGWRGKVGFRRSVYQMLRTSMM